MYCTPGDLKMDRQVAGSRNVSVTRGENNAAEPRGDSKSNRAMDNHVYALRRRPAARVESGAGGSPIGAGTPCSSRSSSFTGKRYAAHLLPQNSVN
ncbi:unnamed protein product [Gongylonema pulchrum]|uniref:Transposase n=1 Tax=Gongylonema pulchrum TaxID=637853 RepID=A0A183ENT6_9BILA|nr:unnamed protein product [Gongylonema pulchrum]